MNCCNAPTARWWVVAAVLFNICAVVDVRADEVVLAGDIRCPYSCEDADRPGFLIEVARRALERYGHSVAYKPMPWSRAIEEARAGKCRGIVGAVRSDAPEFLFPEVRIAESESELYVKKGIPWRYAGPGDLDSVSLGVVQGHGYSDVLNRYIQENIGNPRRIQITSGEFALHGNVAKLLAGRVDVVLEDRRVMRRFIAIHGYEDDLAVAGREPGAALSVALSPAFTDSKKLVEEMTEGTRRLAESGELARILAEYP